MTDHVERMSRVYSPVTWDVYERLDRGLDPAGPDSLHELAAGYLSPGARILDAGCRDAYHLIRLLEAHDATGVAADPVARHVAMAREAVAGSGLGERIEVFAGVAEELPHPDGHFDLIWARDVLEQVADLPGFTRALARLLRPGGCVIAYTNVVTGLLEAGEDAMLRRHLGNVRANLDERDLLAAYASAGLTVDRRISIGTEWREWAEERTRPASESLLRLARLRRQRESVVAEHGLDVYEHVEANLHWLLYQFMGKLEPVVHVLRHVSA
ncbi:class I SAM-dependent methyltransferase [Phytomonospora sp. NPDC050363]|uniref:class I SAM-dependent methyltransferase n=1 Tax=Phytomonospora sp. NPDC050363 TaxID=3155642 RepID=UPI0033E823B9